MKKIIILLLVFTSLFANAQSKRKLFGLDLSPTPSLDFRIAIGQVGSPSANMTMQQFLDFTTTNLDVYTTTQIDNLFSNYLAKNNLSTYTPTQDYHPSTKKYVDDKSKASYVSITSFGSNTSGGVGKASQTNNVVNFSGKFADDGLQDGNTAFTLPASISAPIVDIYIHAGSISGGGSARLKISSGSKIAIVEDQESGTGAVMSFNEVYLTSN